MRSLSASSDQRLPGGSCNVTTRSSRISCAAEASDLPAVMAFWFAATSNFAADIRDVAAVAELRGLREPSAWERLLVAFTTCNLCSVSMPYRQLDPLILMY